MSDGSTVEQTGDEWSREREWVIEADDEIATAQLMRVIEDYKDYKNVINNHVVRMMEYANQSKYSLVIEEFEYIDLDENNVPIYAPLTSPVDERARVHSRDGDCFLYKAPEKRCTLRIVIYRRKDEALREYWSSFLTAIERRFDAVGIEYRPLLGPDEAMIAEALRRGEGQDVEFKQAKPGNNKLARKIAAFATSNAGRIFLGITDEGRVVGLRNCQGSKERDDLRNDIDNICSNNVRPPITAGIEFVEWDGMTVCAISVPKGLASIYYVNNVPYVRRGSQSRPADPAEVEAIYAQRYTQGQSSR